MSCLVVLIRPGRPTLQVAITNESNPPAASFQWWGHSYIREEGNVYVQRGGPR